MRFSNTYNTYAFDNQITILIILYIILCNIYNLYFSFCRIFFKRGRKKAEL